LPALRSKESHPDLRSLATVRWSASIGRNMKQRDIELGTCAKDSTRDVTKIPKRKDPYTVSAL
jgi:hypothetical protein